jgi:hypothetical protein
VTEAQIGVVMPAPLIVNFAAGLRRKGVLWPAAPASAVIMPMSIAAALFRMQ